MGSSSSEIGNRVRNLIEAEAATDRRGHRTLFDEADEAVDAAVVLR